MHVQIKSKKRIMRNFQDIIKSCFGVHAGETSDKVVFDEFQARVEKRSRSAVAKPYLADSLVCL